jgi:lysophospholipase L1-like esterase
MARNAFGGSVSDYVVSLYTLGSSKLAAFTAATLTFFDAETGGNQVTDLALNADGSSPVTQVNVPATGDVPTFYGPDGVTQLWVSANGSASRVKMVSLEAAAAAVTGAQAAASEAAGHATDAASSATAAEQAAASVPATTDAAMAPVLSDPESASAGVLNAAIAGQQDPKIHYGTKRATLVLGSANTTQTAPGSAIDWLQRALIRLPVTTTRWRLKIANRDLLRNVALTTPIGAGPTFIGDPVKDSTTGRWNGKATAALTQVLAGYTVPTDGTDYVSPWVTDPSFQFTKNVDRVLSWDNTIGTGGNGYAAEFVRLVWHNGSQGAAQAPLANPLGFWSAVMLCDMRLEYEFADTAAIGLFIGDSITAGFSDGDVTKTQPGTHAHDAWPAQAGQAVGYVATNLGIGSADHTNFAAGSYALTRVDLATTVPDFAVLSLGTNDGLVAGLSTVQAALTAILSNLRSQGIQKLYVTTIPPRANTQGYLTANAASGATTISGSYNPGVGQQIILDSGRAQESLTVSAVSGTGPYTLTVGALAAAHTGGSSLLAGAAQIISGNEILRQQLNDWFRQLPGVDGVLDFDDALAVTKGSAVPDKRIMSADNLHPMRAGYARLAQVAGAVLRR